MNCFRLKLVDAYLTNPCMCRSAGREGEEEEEGDAEGRRRRYQVKLLDPRPSKVNTYTI